jgi:hypothetical protein
VPALERDPSIADGSTPVAAASRHARPISEEIWKMFPQEHKNAALVYLEGVIKPGQVANGFGHRLIQDANIDPARFPSSVDTEAVMSQYVKPSYIYFISVCDLAISRRPCSEFLLKTRGEFTVA